MTYSMTLFHELYGRDRPIGIKRGMHISELSKRFESFCWDERGIGYFDDGETEVLCEQDGEVRSVLIAFSRFGSDDISVFGRPYRIRHHYGVGEICEFLFNHDIGFKFASGETANRKNCDLVTELGDRYFFRKERVHFRLIEVTSKFL